MSGRKKKKPEYDAESVRKTLLDLIVGYYYSVGSNKNADHLSLRAVADEFDFTHLKARKMLITAGAYHTDLSDDINDMRSRGLSIPEIMKVAGLSRASVHSYLPYTKAIYNAEELSQNAERIKRFRQRETIVKKIREAIDEDLDNANELLWKAIILFEDYPFYTVKGLKYRYSVKGNEIMVNRKKKSITRATIELALENALNAEGMVNGPKQLNVFGASYIYPVFRRLTIV